MDDGKYVRATVTARRDVCPGLWIVRVRPDEKLNFVPGQYLTVGLPGTPRMIERPYSVASSPREAELEFFLELVPDGQLTPQLYNVPVGKEVYIRRAAKGRFVLDENHDHRHHLMVATVTGVAPYVSIVRELAARAQEGKQISGQIAVLQSAGLSEELGYRAELSEYARRHDWLHYIPTVSRKWLDPSWTGEVGRAEDVVRKYMDALGFAAETTTAYVCGNPNMIENVKGVLKRSGFAREFIKEELYWVQHAGAD